MDQCAYLYVSVLLISFLQISTIKPQQYSWVKVLVSQVRSRTAETHNPLLLPQSNALSQFFSLIKGDISHWSSPIPVVFTRWESISLHTTLSTRRLVGYVAEASDKYSDTYALHITYWSLHYTFTESTKNNNNKIERLRRPVGKQKF